MRKKILIIPRAVPGKLRKRVNPKIPRIATDVPKFPLTARRAAAVRAGKNINDTVMFLVLFMEREHMKEMNPPRMKETSMINIGLVIVYVNNSFILLLLCYFVRF